MTPIDILVATSTDFALLRNGRPVASGTWDDVLEARGYKEDGFTVDTVCLALRLRDGSVFLANEDAPGWDDLIDAAEAALPGMPRRQDWWPGVVKPAFSRNELVLFNRSRQ
jgi:hypothetical protein